MSGSDDFAIKSLDDSLRNDSGLCGCCCVGTTELAGCSGRKADAKRNKSISVHISGANDESRIVLSIEYGAGADRIKQETLGLADGVSLANNNSTAHQLSNKRRRNTQRSPTAAP